MEENKRDIGSPFGGSEQRGLTGRAVNKAASYFPDDDSLFEFEGFEIEGTNKDIYGASLNDTADKAGEITESEAYADEGADYASEDEEAVGEEDFAEEKIEEITENEAYADEGADYASEGEEAVGEEDFAEEKIEEITESEAYADEGEDYAPEGEEAVGEEDFAEGKIEEITESEAYADEGEDYATEGEEAVGEEDFAEEKIEEITESEAYADEGADYASEGEEAVGEEGFAEEKTAETVKSSPRKYTEAPSEYSFESKTVNAEGQISFEGTETSEEPKNQGAEASLDEADKKELFEADGDGDDGDIWDKAGKEEWEAREAFLAYCKSLTLPPVKSVSRSVSPEAESVKQKVNSSGYRYAESERMPVFSDGMNGGIDKEGYKEREKRYCENRYARRETDLRERVRSRRIAVLGTAAILFVVFVLEIINFASVGHEALFAGIETGLTLLGAVFVWKSLCDGVKCAVKGVFIPELLAFLTVLCSLTFNFVTAFSAVAAENKLLIGIPGAIAVLLTAAYAYLMAEREKKVFDVTGEYGNYCTEVKLASFKGSPEEIAFGGYAAENSSLYKTNRISRVDGGYNAQPVRDECFGLIKILIICIISAAVAGGIAFGFIKRDAYYGLLSAYLIIGFASPLCVFMSLALSRYITAQSLAEDGAAITDFDEESDELDESVIMLRETELFPPEKINVTDTYWKNSHLLEAHLSRAAAAFRKIGGLLSELFSSIDINPGDYGDVQLTDVSDNGITVRVDGSDVIAGSDTYLEKHGVEIERYPDIPAKDTRVLYIANGGEFFARIVIRFVPDAELCRRISELRQTETLFSLKTCNPCIDSELVFYTVGLEPELLRVVKYKVLDDVAGTDTDREGILVSRAGAAGLLSAFIGCKRQKRLVLLGSRIAAAAGLAGVLLSLTVALFGVKWKFISFLILGFHIVTSAVAAGVALYGRGRGGKSKKR